MKSEKSSDHETMMLTLTTLNRTLTLTSNPNVISLEQKWLFCHSLSWNKIIVSLMGLRDDWPHLFFSKLFPLDAPSTLYCLPKWPSSITVILPVEYISG